MTAGTAASRNNRASVNAASVSAGIWACYVAVTLMTGRRTAVEYKSIRTPSCNHHARPIHGVELVECDKQQIQCHRYR